jgi:hypothetical protein
VTKSLVRIACRDFFTENGIEFTSEPIPSTTPSTPDWTPQIHKSTSGTLSIIQVINLGP